MSELTKLEAGKTYVFKNEEAKEAWLDHNTGNLGLHSDYYVDGFNIDRIEHGEGYIKHLLIITRGELKYFKLKEDETMQQPKHICPEDKATITTTYGELAVALTLLGEVSSEGRDGLLLYNQICELFGVKYLNLPKVVDNSIYFHKVKDRVYSVLFPEPTPVESPTQRKARELREQAELLLAKARELEESM